MITRENAIIYLLLVVSVLFLLAPVIALVVRKIDGRKRENRRTGIDKAFGVAICVVSSIWCLRYAIGYSGILSQTNPLSWWEALIQTLFHALQCLGGDSDYVQYLEDGKVMMDAIFGESSGMRIVFSLYHSLLDVIAPIAGGAVLFELLASIFPKIRLRLSHWIVWREKYYFSECNQCSIALAKSIDELKYPPFRKPILIFTNFDAAQNDGGEENLAFHARSVGAICLKDKLSTVRKNRFGKRKFFLMEANESEKLKTLADLANETNAKYLKKTEVYFFADDDAYVQIENRLRDKLRSDFGFCEEELPVFIPVQSCRNLVSNLLVDIPLYEPLIGRKPKEDGRQDLRVTILGNGFIGMEMLLSTYWFGQILDCDLHIHVLSKEKEEFFWGKLDSLNPEIRYSTIENHEILRVNRKGDMAPVYCHIHYTKCDVESDVFMECLQGNSNNSILDSDYILVALGSDKKDLLVANTVKKFVGQNHISHGAKRTVLAYVVADAELADILNRKQNYDFDCNGTDIFMCAVGSLRDVYSVRNVFMTHHANVAQKISQAYDDAKERRARGKIHAKRMLDDYKHWANLARSMHVKYKMFSMGLFQTSLFDYAGPYDDKYVDMLEKTYAKYREVISGNVTFQDKEEEKAFVSLIHKLSWLEHRRWNAFTRVKGFRYTGEYDRYAKAGEIGSYKQMELKLHPCLVECDQLGIRGAISDRGLVDENSLMQWTDPENFDLLDELSYDVFRKGYNDYDFKLYDYPKYDA